MGTVPQSLHKVHSSEAIRSPSAYLGKSLYTWVFVLHSILCCCSIKSYYIVLSRLFKKIRVLLLYFVFRNLDTRAFMLVDYNT